MNPWVTYYIERLHLLFLSIVIIGIALSGVMLDGRVFRLFPFVFSIITLYSLVLYLRLHNDLEDCDNDKIAFPERALPRGLIPMKEAQQMLSILGYGLILLFAFIFVLFKGTVRLTLLISSVYFWLLIHDFYAKKTLKRYPLIYGIAKQGLIIPVTMLIISFGRPNLVFSLPALSYILLLFGAFFTFEICRKLNPFAHPVSLSYVHFYGFRATFWLAVGTLVLSGIGAYGMGINRILWTCELLVALSLLLLFIRPRNYRLAEVVSSLSLIVHACSGLFPATFH